MVNDPVEFADKWVTQITQSLNNHGSDISEVVTQATMIIIISKIFGWLCFLLGLIICIKIVSKFASNKLTVNEGPTRYLFGVIAGTFVGIIMLIGFLINLPGKELVGVFYPKGYIAAKIFEKITTPEEK